MNRRNYQKELDAIISRQEKPGARILLHSCCGPCSSSVLEYLTQFFEVTLLWYNPNLYPEAEYAKRLATQRELIDKMELCGRVKLLVEPWQSEDYRSAVRGLEKEPEGGKRCEACFRLRLKKTAELARDGGYDFFCTTLTLSRHKNAELINDIGEEIARETGVRWLPSDFKKQGREMRSSELARRFGLYQQLYCGCAFSLNKREETNEPSEEGKAVADE